MNKRRIVTQQYVSEGKRVVSKKLRSTVTEAESVLWQALRRSKLKGLHFRRQQVIEGFVVDFYCHAAGLMIELDGGVHEGQEEYDKERDAILTARGLRVMRFSNEMAPNDFPAVLEQIVTATEEQPKAPLP